MILVPEAAVNPEKSVLITTSSNRAADNAFSILGYSKQIDIRAHFPRLGTSKTAQAVADISQSDPYHLAESIYTTPNDDTECQKVADLK